MAPVLFKDVGKKARDMLKKEYVSDNELELKTATVNGVNFTTNARRSGAGFNTDFEVEYQDKPAGLAVKEKLLADQTLSLEVTLTNKLADGTKVTVESRTKGGEPKAVKAGVEYANSSSNSQVSLDVAHMVVDASTVVAYEQFLFGARTSIDINKHAVQGADVVAAYAGKDFTVTAGLNSATDEVSTTYIHKLSSHKASVAGSYTFNTNKGTSTFAVGGQHDCCEGAFVKGKIDNRGLLSLVYSQKMSNNLTVGLGTSIVTSNLGCANSQDIGVSLKFSG